MIHVFILMVGFTVNGHTWPAKPLTTMVDVISCLEYTEEMLKRPEVTSAYCMSNPAAR